MLAPPPEKGHRRPRADADIDADHAYEAGIGNSGHYCRQAELSGSSVTRYIDPPSEPDAEADSRFGVTSFVSGISIILSMGISTRQPRRRNAAISLYRRIADIQGRMGREARHVRRFKWMVRRTS
jgi:hypothetical protein